MRPERARRQERQEGRPLFVLLIAAILTLAPPTLAAAEGSFSLGGARVVDVPEFSYEVAEVAFDEPRNFSSGAGVIRRLELVRVVVQGRGFRPKATGPVVWLNGIPTLRTDVAEDGTRVEAYFLEPLQEIEKSAARLGRWELLYQPHEGAQEVFRISPTGDPAGAHQPPEVLRLSPEERARIEALKREHGIE
jgi:hypothetical protein